MEERHQQRNGAGAPTRCAGVGRGRAPVTSITNPPHGLLPAPALSPRDLGLCWLGVVGLVSFLLGAIAHQVVAG